MNFIFDIGNVILSFKPEKFLIELWGTEVDIDILYKTIFESKEWELLDGGMISQEEAVNRMCLASPENEQSIRKTFDCWLDMFTPLDETISFIEELKEQKHKLYYLSNFHKKASKWIVAKYPVFSLFDGGVFSCDVQLLKPDVRIYQYLLQKYKLDPRTCLFLDDMKVNVVAAREVGINSMQFSAVSKVKETIENA